jgi:hypothetical protein
MALWDLNRAVKLHTEIVRLWADTVAKPSRLRRSASRAPSLLYTVRFALQLWKSHGKTSVRISGKYVGEQNLVTFMRAGVCLQSNCVWSRNLKRGSLGPTWAVAPQKAEYRHAWYGVFILSFSRPRQLCCTDSLPASAGSRAMIKTESYNYSCRHLGIWGGGRRYRYPSFTP